MPQGASNGQSRFAVLLFLSSATILFGTSCVVLIDAAVIGYQSRDTAVQMLLYVGTSELKSKGIYVSRWDLSSGARSQPELTVETENPSFFTLHPNGRFLYAVNEIKLGEEVTGYVQAFALDVQNGKLTALNKRPSHGIGPCYLAVDTSGTHILVANCRGGGVAALAIDKDGNVGEPTGLIRNAGLSEDPQKEDGPHAHSISLDKANRFAFAPDPTLDKVFLYRFDVNQGTLAHNDPPSVSVNVGAGPRHFAFHPKGAYAYVVNELQSAITAFQYDSENGVLSEMQTVSTLPASFKRKNSATEVLVHPSGKLLYASNIGHDSITGFAIDPVSGKLKPIQTRSTGGRTPRSFEIDPAGNYLFVANQHSDNVVVFRIHPVTGRIDEIGPRLVIPSPICVKSLVAK